jgi:hypothetical protein
MVSERGSAVVLALLAMVLLGALGAALLVGADVETRVAANYRDGMAAVYAAETAIEMVLPDLLASPDWPALVEALPPVPGAPGWTVYFEAPLRDLVPAAGVLQDLDVGVWIAEDPTAPVERLSIAGRAHGPGGIRRTVQATIVRTAVSGAPQLRIAYWREARRGLQ